MGMDAILNVTHGEDLVYLQIFFVEMHANLLFLLRNIAIQIAP